ncbi:MAG: EF-Tu/IF-2/RF-3 family GTPase, partial [Candidatus Omnitrophota bacterium]
IAGCFVAKGKVIRNAGCRLWREKEKIYEGKVSSVKRFKEDVKEVAEGFECGIALSNFDDLKIGDVIEVFELRKTARKL